MKIKSAVEISDDRLSDLLCSAFEGGTGYWLQIQGFKMPKEKPVLKNPFWKARHTWVPLVEGGVIQLGVDDDNGGFSQKHELTLAKLKKGLEVMAEKYPKHFNDFIEENDDATTGDVFLQCALLGAIVYG